jgi:methylthioribose-1-phosphate isomerase
MARGQVDLVVTGADRIAANGDSANKIGTYGVAVLARHHGIPFYVAAPWSTIDPAIESGASIVIEERDPAEVRGVAGRQTAPSESPIWNPAFDVTPAALIAAIITERGVYRAPYHFA